MTDIRTEGVFGLFIAELVDEVNGRSLNSSDRWWDVNAFLSWSILTKITN